MSDYKDFRLAIAPMMDWTDRHCRFLHRQLTRRALLYTEMVVADAVIHGQRERLLGFDASEQPVALQLGGSDPEKLAEAARIGEAFGYREINLNVGCPSDRVQSGTFGACLMRTPALVGACVAAMKQAVAIPVTVKCRIGVDEQDPEIALDELADAVFAAGVDALWVHARKAWLEGLSPKENRDIPPLDYGRVYRLKAKFRNRFIGINGGIQNLDEAVRHLAHVDGVMLGRAAYHTPGLLAGADAAIFGEAARETDWAGADRNHGRLLRPPHRRRRPAGACDAPHDRPVPRPARRPAFPADPVDRGDTGRGGTRGAARRLCGGRSFRRGAGGGLT